MVDAAAPRPHERAGWLRGTLVGAVTVVGLIFLATSGASLYLAWTLLEGAEPGTIARESARTALTLQILLFAVELVTFATALVVVRRRVVVPLGRVTLAMTHLADGDLGVAVPMTRCCDEVDAMARAVELFRQNTIRRAQAMERRQQAERRLTQELTERNLILAIQQEAFPDGFLMIDAADRLHSWNQRFVAIWGLPDSVLNTGQSLDSLLEAAAGLVRDRQDFSRHMHSLDPHTGEEGRGAIELGDGRTIEVFTRALMPAAGDYRGRIWFFRDITERVNTQEQLRTLWRAVEYSPVSVMITDGRGIIEYVNPRFTECTGYEPQEVIGQTPNFLRSPQTPPEVYDDMWETISTGRTWNGEFYNRKKDGACFWEKNSIAPIRGADDKITHYVAIKEDITERKDAEFRIWQQAHFDALTRLPNRSLFNDRLSQEVVRARRSGSPLAVMFVDLDRFKQVNDTLGHDAGDQLLQQVAARLRLCVRESDTVSRVGGDEFIILLTDLNRDGEASDIAHRIIYELSEPFLIGSREASIGVSIGISIHPRDGDNPASLLRNADLAMYWSKAGGRNTYRFFSTHPSDFLDGYG